MLRIFSRAQSLSVAARPAAPLAFKAPAGSVAQPRRFFSEFDEAPIGHAEGRETGTVKWFDSAKGYGFIVRDSGTDLFVHFSSISGEGYRSLEEGQRVEFEVGSGIKGPVASEVVVVE